MTFHKPLFVTLLATALAFVLAACGAASSVTTPPTAASDPQSAGAFMPAVPGFTVTGASSLSDAITAAADSGAKELGNPVLERTISTVDNFVSCYQQAGAVAANIYTQTDLSAALSGNVQVSAGAVAIVNQDRVRENLLNCVTSSASADGAFAAQAVTTCQQSGSFSSGGDTFTYIYISTSNTFCNTVQQHFNGIG